MKINLKTIKMNFKKLNFILVSLLIFVGSASSQENAESQTGDENAVVQDEKKEKKPIKNTFENGILLDKQTVIQPKKKSFEMVIQHRFGNMNSDQYDLLGILGSSNIRIGLNYALWDRFQIGVGTMKHRYASDLNWKWAVLRQTKEKGIPVSITYYGNATVEALDEANYAKPVHRFNYFHQVIIARKFHKNFSAQIDFSYCHFNVVDSSKYTPEGETEQVNHDYKHDNFSVGLSGRVKVSPQTSITFEYTQPLIFLDVDQAQPNISVGAEIATSGHSFQVFIGTYRYLLPQYNMVYSDSKFWKGEILIGFNITRLWSF